MCNPDLNKKTRHLEHGMEINYRYIIGYTIEDIPFYLTAAIQHNFQLFVFYDGNILSEYV